MTTEGFTLTIKGATLREELGKLATKRQKLIDALQAREDKASVNKNHALALQEQRAKEVHLKAIIDLHFIIAHIPTDEVFRLTISEVVALGIIGRNEDPRPATPMRS